MAIVNERKGWPTYPHTTNKTANDICASLLNRHDGRGEICIQEAEMGVDGRVDFMAVKFTWHHIDPTVYEVKVSRSDFKADKKWPKYLKYCSRFYFACPEGLIAPEELEPGIGLVWVSDDGFVRIQKKSKIREFKSGPEKERILHRVVRKFMYPRGGLDRMIQPGHSEPLCRPRGDK